MKHISFDESTVLGEYARIASEQGFIKEAAENPLLSETKRLNSLFAQMMQKYNSDHAKVSPLYEAEVAKSVAGLKKQFGEHPEIAKFEQQVKSISAPDKGSVTDVIRPNTSVNESELSKSAEGKLYDVSGETGEQLVDSAHPGGGTRTELTHSKTDENLVETIVEQQKKDIEVAQSVPKGTYATLKHLHTKLEKLGTDKKYLNKLAGIIDSVYTPEGFMIYRLAQLSDDLDTIGSHEAADKVDVLMALAVGPGVSSLMQAAPSAVTMAPAAGKLAPWLAGAAGKVAPLAGAALPWLGVAGGVAAVGLAGYFLYKDLAAAESNLDGLIDRLGDLDPNERAQGTIQGWISTFTQMKSKMVIPQASPDADTQKQIVQQRSADLQMVADQLASFQQQWPQIEPNLTDMGFDKSQAKTVLDQTAARIGQLAQQAAAKLPKIEEAAEVQKQEEAKGVASKNVPEPGKKKPKGSWRQRVVTDFAAASKFAHWYNKIIGTAGEHDTAIRVSDEARVAKTVTRQMKADIEKALARIAKVGSGKEWAKKMREGEEGGASVEQPEGRIVGDKSTEDVAKYHANIDESVKQMVSYGWKNLFKWTGLQTSQMRVDNARLMRQELRNMSEVILKEVAPYGADAKVPKFSGHIAKGLIDALKAKVVERYKSKG